MRWQKRSDVRTDEGAAERAGEPAPSTSPVSLVDDALRVASGRQLFTRDEALGLLRRVGSEVDDPVRAASVERIVADADTGSAEQMMVSCTDLVDPLLDIRLVLCS
jgi:hypothetical protein